MVRRRNSGRLGEAVRGWTVALSEVPGAAGHGRGAFAADALDEITRQDWFRAQNALATLKRHKERHSNGAGRGYEPDSTSDSWPPC